MGLLGRLFGRSSEPPDVYTGLRRQALTLRPDQIGLTPGPDAPIYGVIMETGYPDAVATFVCMGDGTTSLYLSTGGGILGAGDHESVRNACLRMLAITNEYAADFIAACESADPGFPLPGDGEVVFHLLTTEGVHDAAGLEEDLGEQRHPFSALFNNCHQVMGEMRMVDEALRGGA